MKLQNKSVKAIFQNPKSNPSVKSTLHLQKNAVQGLNRVQQAPGVSKAMHSILYKCQRQIGNWVGSSVIHLGDHNVPNALMFIDKYTQVQMLNTVPITHAYSVCALQFSSLA